MMRLTVYSDGRGHNKEGMLFLFRLLKIPYTLSKDGAGISSGSGTISFKPPCGQKAKKLSASSISLSLGPNFRQINELLMRHGFSTIQLPLDWYYHIPDLSEGFEVLARFEPTGYPAIIKRGDDIHFLFEIGAAISNLIDERYFESEHRRATRFGNLFSSLPYTVKRIIAKLFYRIEAIKLRFVDSFVTHYPFDPTFWALQELFLSCIGNIYPDYFVSLSPWPGYQSAVSFSHDVEPTTYAYTAGLTALRTRLRQKRIRSTIYLVSDFALRYLNKQTLKDIESEGHVMASHSSKHDLNFDKESSEARYSDILHSKKSLQQAGISVEGFRSPYLYRTPDMACLLKKARFTYDSSVIDVDREAPGRVGSGVGMSLPYIQDNIVEIPVTGPIDSGILWKYSFKDIEQVIKSKMQWVSETGGLYNLISHAGCWGKEDDDNKGRVLDIFFEAYKQLPGKVWLATHKDISGWWHFRDKIKITPHKAKIKIVFPAYSRHKVHLRLHTKKRFKFKADAEITAKRCRYGYDIGLRPNKTTLTISLTTSPS